MSICYYTFHMNHEFSNVAEIICQKDPRYRHDAYEFVMEALHFTQKKFHRSKHVTGPELLEGMKELLMEKFGPMTMLVLKHWGINATEDFGNIVFNLVENRVLSKTEEDSLEHFRNGYSFEEVFERGYRIRLEKRISRMRS